VAFLSEKNYPGKPSPQQPHKHEHAPDPEPVARTQSRNYYTSPAPGRWITRLTFRLMLLRPAYTVPTFRQMLEGIAFARTRIDANDIGMEVWLEK
jgi:hypothetical protein